MSSRPHDALFKSGFADPTHIHGLYRGTYPPSICDRIDWSTAKPEPASFVDPKLDDNHSDLLFSARLRPRDGADKAESILLYLLLEHFSTNYRYMPLQSLTYLERIYQR